jgi:uncharacterized protein (TIGR00288 family)
MPDVFFSGETIRALRGPAPERMSTPDPRTTRIAVFIDFDNVEIGVKNTIGGQFDIAPVLEAIKERGEIVTKVAYSDWKRAGDYSRILAQHAIRMVQRSMTPGGDKNGADITMALDALEMAFTHDHINAFVIVGGDSDFISLVEKLKQYGRQVIVVGGRQFTSKTMQTNCHEFIAYENLVGKTSRGGGRSGRAQAPAAKVDGALPLVQRALKVLSEREVTPQLGLLKSTLLQLDSTFSEREYGAGSFRDFMEKVAQTGLVTLRQAGRSMLVEPADAAAVTPAESDVDVDADGEGADQAAEASPPAVRLSNQEGIKAVRQALVTATPPPRWPMYARQARQFLRGAIEGFDERAYGFASVTDLLRAAGKEGVLRVERDRQGAVRVFPGANLALPPAPEEDAADESAAPAEVQPAFPVAVAATGASAEADAGAVADVVSDAPADDATPAPAAKKKATRARKTGAKKTGASKKTAGAAGTGSRKRTPRKA